ncbi:MAG: YqgE/AlgH family protein [Deltaproteobacteria bacterium]|nr:YqgE/AlgH family protein [Deltaproteobacteria bacterium]
MKRLLVTLPVLAALVLGGAAAQDWAWGDPDLPALARTGGHAQLPPLDEPCTGHVITADRALDGTLFGAAAVVLCLHDGGGALGFVVNRPTGEHVRAVVPGARWTAGSVRWGGPVAPGQGAVIYRRDGRLRFTTMALRAPFPATGWLRAPRVRDDEIVFVLAGYSGWSAGQLEAEVEGGSWILTDVEPEVFLRDPRPPWLRQAEPTAVSDGPTNSTNARPVASPSTRAAPSQ